MSGGIRVAVVGASGRMGQPICASISADPELELVGALGSRDDVSELGSCNVQVVVDVTNAAAARTNLVRFAAMGLHSVVGTTGFTEADVHAFHEAYVAAERSCFVVPNFSIGAVLLMRFAEQAAPFFDGVEVIELHHNHKRDAPSGTAQSTAERIAAARTEPWAPDPTEHEAVAGVRGGEAAPGVRVHSVRLPGLLAHQEVLFGGPGQSLTIRHDSFDRVAFMPGVLRAVKGVGALPTGVTSGLDAVLWPN